MSAHHHPIFVLLVWVIPGFVAGLVEVIRDKNAVRVKDLCLIAFMSLMGWLSIGVAIMVWLETHQDLILLRLPKWWRGKGDSR